MVQPPVGAYCILAHDGAGLGVGGPEHHPGDPRVDERARAHRAGLEGDVDRCPLEPPMATCPRGATISACAVGSWSISRRFRPRASSLPSALTTTHPTGTSPLSAAAPAS